jgi:hypothetical protein
MSTATPEVLLCLSIIGSLLNSVQDRVACAVKLITS